MSDARSWTTRRAADGLTKGDDLAEPLEQLTPERFPTTAHRGGHSMRGKVFLILGGLLLSPGILTAAEKMTTQGPPGATAPKVHPQKLDLNRATREQLVDVPGIGPRMAQAIVDLRSRKGSFTRFEDLLEVTGIKEKKLATLAGYLEVVPLQTSAATAPAAQPK
jgi:competence ComEA-like helix-hairpin-helix protein